MKIKRIIDRNRKKIWHIIIIIICILFAIKSLNSFYEKDEEKKQAQVNNSNNNTNKITQTITEKEYTTESDSIKITMASFVNYCNNREIEKAYKMLTDECKKAMFPTKDYFEKIYINKLYNIQRNFEMKRWLTKGNKATYLVTLYGDILATGGTSNSTQEYCTFVKDDYGNYKLNINNYIYGYNKNKSQTVANVTIEIGQVDVYEEYEQVQITVKNKNNKKVCLTGDKNKEKIYLQNSSKQIYSSLNSRFESENIILEPNSIEIFTVSFNKIYGYDEVMYLILGDIILDYDSYLKSEDQINYSNRTSIKIEY